MKKLVSNLAKDLNLEEFIITKTYKSYWKYIKNIIEGIPLKNGINSIDFNNIRLNFNIPSLGKLYVDRSKYLIKHGKYKDKKNKTNV